MANSNSATRLNRLPPQRTDFKDIGNLILLSLSPQERKKLFPLLEFAPLKLHTVLHEVGEVIKSLYFLDNGLATVLTAQTDGQTVEVGLIGNEGFVGLPAPFGFNNEFAEGSGSGRRNTVSLGRFRGL